MDSPIIRVRDPRAILAGKDGELWLPLSESPALSARTETVNCAGVFFDVVGYSEERDALLVSPIVIESAAAHIEQELEEFLGK